MERRNRPLQGDAPDEAPALTGAAAEAEAEMEALAHDVVAAGPASRDPAVEARRLQRLSDGVQRLRTSGSLRLGERTLMVLGGILAPLGLLLVIAGWNGAARTPNLFEQIPYAISGGLFGLGLTFLGAFLYFAHWMTELVKEHRAQSTAIVEALGRLEDALRTSAPSAAAPAAVTANGQPLVATERGTMAHRPDCAVVAAKQGLRPVTPADGLAPCKLCDPYALASN